VKNVEMYSKKRRGKSLVSTAAKNPDGKEKKKKMARTQENVIGI